MGFSDKYIEWQLSHVEKKQEKAAYISAKYLPEREQMMQHWANYLDAISQPGSTATLRSFSVKWVDLT
jgi:hypothetical protein